MIERKKIREGVYLTQLPDDKFKRSKITVNFMVPNERDKATMYALLPGLLERAYEDYPEMLLLSRKLNRMYSASLRAGTYVTGQNRSIRFSIQGIKNRYCPDSEEDLLGEMCDVLLGVIFRPCLKDGAFVDEWLEVEKYKLREEIEAEINDKRGYCIKNARRLFFGDSMNGVERLGYEEEIESITSEMLYDCYLDMLDKAYVEIFVSADDVSSVEKKITEAFGYKSKTSADMLPVELTPCEDTVILHNDSMDTVQGKVCLMYTTTRKLESDDRFRMLVATALFGGSPVSRLFKNVREKQSLCYYCAAGFSGFTSSMSVDSGVEHENAQNTVEAIKHELQRLITEGATDKEISEIKLILKNSLMSSYDSLASLEAWYMNESFIGTMLTPEQAVEKIYAVTEKDIREMLSLLHLNVIYTITK